MHGLEDVEENRNSLIFTVFQSITIFLSSSSVPLRLQYSICRQNFGSRHKQWAMTLKSKQRLSKDIPGFSDVLCITKNNKKRKIRNNLSGPFLSTLPTVCDHISTSIKLRTIQKKLVKYEKCLPEASSGLICRLPQ